MKRSRGIDVASLLLVVGMFLAAAASWSSAPARIPVHWNFAGEVDRYGGKVEGLLAIPILTLGLYVLFTLLPRIDPAGANYAQFAGAYNLLRLAIVAFMAVIYGATLLAVNGRPVDIGTVVPLLVGALFVLLGAVMDRLRPNWFVGIRTPWTLSSQRSWTRTHRLGGYWFVVTGLAFMAVAVVRSEWVAYLALALAVGGTLVLFAYSYVVWRGDPDKGPPAGALPSSRG